MLLAPKTPILKVGRDLLLVPFDYEDLPLWYAWRQSERVARFMRGSRAQSLSLSKIMGSSEILAPWPRQTWQWLLRGSDNTPLGSVSVLFMPHGVNWGETLIGPDEVAGRGIGSAVKRAVLERLFQEPSVEYVRTYVDPHNTASLSMNKKHGAVLQPDGHLLFQRPLVRGPRGTP